METRSKTRNGYFTFLRPGAQDGDGIAFPDVEIAIPNSGEFVSITGPRAFGEQPSAVFYSPDELRALAQIINEAVKLFEAAQANPK